jgi:copper chaperone CopZ
MIDHRDWAAVYSRLAAVPAVMEVDLSLVRGLATIQLGASCPAATLIEAVRAAGCDAEVRTDGSPPRPGDGPGGPRADA